MPDGDRRFPLVPLHGVGPARIGCPYFDRYGRLRAGTNVPPPSEPRRRGTRWPEAGTLR